MKSLLRSLKFMRPYWLQALATLFFTLLATGAALITPTLTQRLIDQGIAQSNMRMVITLSVGIFLAAVLGGLFSFFQRALAARVAHGIAYYMRNALYDKIQSLSFSYHDRAQTGQLLTRATSDVDRVQRFVGRGAINFISALLMMVGAMVLLISVNASLASIMAVVIPVTVVLFLVFARVATPLFREVQQRLAALNTVLQENLAGIRVVKAFVREQWERHRFLRANEALYDINLRVNNIVSLAFPTIFLVMNGATVAVYWLGGQQVIEGYLSVGEVVAFANYMVMAFFPILELGMIISMMSEASASSQRVFEILDAPSGVVEREDAIELPPIQGRVEFDHVTFRYFQSGEPALKDVSFVAEPGQQVALLGATGSGKSTIINLIPRFYDVTEGRVLIDGYDVRDVTIESLRRQIGIVLQETTLFEGTIRENIAFGRPEASMEKIIAAAKAAEAHDFITSFADGYDTYVGERGVTLSGGQKQRIAIARALIMDPRILILDDATSSVDLVTEYRIQQALNRLMKGRTSFVIAQRVATVLNADQILVLDKGEIVAKGTHEELMAESEIYVEIYNSQLMEDVELPPDLEEMREVAS